AGCEGDPPRHPAAVFGRGKDPDRADWSARRGQHRRAVPARGDCAEPLLPLVEGISGGGQETPGRRHGAGRDVGRGHTQGTLPHRNGPLAMPRGTTVLVRMTDRFSSPAWISESTFPWG